MDVFCAGAREERWMGGGRLCQGGVDQPAEGFDAGPAQVGLEAFGFVDRCGFGEGDDDHVRELGVA